MYDLDYVVYKNNRLVSVRCMRCGTEVRTLAAGTLTTWDGRQVEICRMVELPKLCMGKKIEIQNPTLKSRSFIDPIICTDCENEVLDEVKIVEQVKHGWKVGLEAQRKSPEDVSRYMENEGNVELFREVESIG